MPRLSAEQRIARRQGLGASDIAEMLGISPYEHASPIRLFAEKSGLVADDDEEEESIEKRVGHAVEPALVKLYEEESKYEVETLGQYVESVTHPEHSWVRCNLDGRVKHKRVALEIKHVGIGMHSDWDLLADDGIPHYVRVQNIWQCLAADLDEVHNVTMIAGRFRIYYVNRDRELEGALFEAADAFWKNVQAKRMPPLDGSAAARELLEKLYPSPAKPIEIEASPELRDLMLARIKAAESESLMKQRKEILNNQIREALGQAGATDAIARDEARRVVAVAQWRQQKNGVRPLRVDAKGEAKAVRAPIRTVETIPDLIDGEAF